MDRLHMRIIGVVQGVGFRYFTQRELGARALVGYVRNLADGRVEAVVEGEPEVVAQALAILGQGPAASQVSDVAVEEIPSEGHTGFEIRS